MNNSLQLRRRDPISVNLPKFRPELVMYLLLPRLGVRRMFSSSEYTICRLHPPSWCLGILGRLRNHPLGKLLDDGLHAVPLLLDISLTYRPGPQRNQHERPHGPIACRERADAEPTYDADADSTRNPAQKAVPRARNFADAL